MDTRIRPPSKGKIGPNNGALFYLIFTKMADGFIGHILAPGEAGREKRQQ